MRNERVRDCGKKVKGKEWDIWFTLVSDLSGVLFPSVSSCYSCILMKLSSLLGNFHLYLYKLNEKGKQKLKVVVIGLSRLQYCWCIWLVFRNYPSLTFSRISGCVIELLWFSSVIPGILIPSNGPWPCTSQSFPIQYT